MNILAISGSLRAASVNSALLRAMKRLAPVDFGISISGGPGRLPLFNPDLEFQVPASVAEFHREVEIADALIIASPEYAHGMTGVIKNALDWLVGFEPLAGKRCAVVNASPRAHHADDSLREVLKTMSVAIVEPASVTLPLIGSGLDEDAMVGSPEIAEAIRELLNRLRD